MNEAQLEKAYTEALLQMREHPRMIWTRNNFFLLSQTGLLAFTLNITNQSGKVVRVIACAAGIFLAVIWLRVNKAGQRLNRDWREIVIKYEEEFFKEGDGPITRASKKGHGAPGSWLSITDLLIDLSIGFLVVWGALLLYSISRFIFTTWD